MFAAITLFVGRPFHVGDGVSVAGIGGTIESKQRFEKEGIEMAYPTQTVHLVNQDARSG
jgi:small-conductance mechanosensitive channel